jgi:IS30 family transposase
MNRLAAKRRVTMSKYFTYEERLSLQKYLKESLSFKEIARRLDKNPTTISREVRKHFSEVATGYPGFQHIAIGD